MITGSIRQKIEIYEPIRVKDGYGGNFDGQIVYWSTNAEVDQRSSNRLDGDTSMSSRQRKLDPIYRFRIHYRNDKEITNDMIIKWRNNWFIIVGYTPDVVSQDFVEFMAVSYEIKNIVTGNNTGS